MRAVCSAVENHSVDGLDRFDEPRTGLILACCLRVLFYHELLPKFLTKSASDQHVEKASDTRKKPQAGLIAKSSSFHSIIFLRRRCRFTARFLLQERILPPIVGVQLLTGRSAARILFLSGRSTS